MIAQRAPQSGIALITAILVVALASIAASAILSATFLAIHRASSIQETEAAWWYASGVETWVKAILKRDAEQNQTDSFKDDWARAVDYLPIDEGAMRGQVEDLQGRFNLNNFGVADSKRYQQYVGLFERLLQNIEGADASRAPAIAAAVRDWIDADSIPTGTDGAEDSEYLSVAPAYRTPNRLMESVTELRAVRGMTAELYDQLMNCADGKQGRVSCITALPQYPTAINVNTAPEPMLRALSKRSSAGLDNFLRDRDNKPMEEASAAYKPEPEGFLSAADELATDAITVKTQFFLLTAEIAVGSSRLRLYSLIFRPEKGSPAVLGRSTDLE